MTFHSKEDLSDAELEFYSRQIVLTEIGYDGQLRLKNSKVGVMGLGGLGSPAVLQLAAMGVGYLRLVDRDVVEPSNLQRQHIYDLDSVGYPKVEVAASRLHRLNPYVELDPRPLSVDSNNAEDLLKGLDVVVDGLDRMAPRYAVNRASQKLKIPYVFGAAIRTFGNASTLVPDRTPCLECFQGNLDDETLPSCGVVGVHPAILSIIASVEVSEATRIMMGEEPRLAGKILHCDVKDLAFEALAISKVASCPVCGSEESGGPMPLKERTLSELCGRDGRKVFVITPKRDLRLDMDELHSLLVARGLKVGIKAQLGLTFVDGRDRTASILRSGIMVVEGMESEKEALDLYAGIMADGLNIPESLWSQ